MEERIKKLEVYTLRLLNEVTTSKLYYHNAVHALDVYNSTYNYVKMEGVKAAFVEPLLAAALLHDIGYLKQYNNNEPIGAEMAANILPQYEFNGTEIELVEKLILATSFPQHPKDKLEYIICDADLDILGTERFFKRSMDLKKEIEENTGKKYTDIEWYKNQLELLQNHQYFTVSGRILRSEGEKINIEMLKKLIRK